jgi:hypothetical protein
MNLSANLSITEKGMEEIKLRRFKLALRARSFLILLDTPKTMEQVLQKTLFPKDETVEELQILIRDGFLAIDNVVSREEEHHHGVSAGNSRLNDDIVLSEGKFLLVDFCVDCFGTRSQGFVDQIRACTSAEELDASLGQIYSAVQRTQPEHMQQLLKLINEINES